MTRRDWCPVCHELVGDSDVCCNDCGVSLCSGCATSYDHLSRFLLLRARFGTLCRPTITYGEYKEFIDSLQSPQLINAIQEYIDTNQDECDDADSSVEEPIVTVEQPIVDVNEPINWEYEEKLVSQNNEFGYIDWQNLRHVWKIFDSMIDFYNKNYKPEWDKLRDVNITNVLIIRKLLHFFDSIQYEFDIPFKCFMCDKGIEVKY